jgi:hypothetical protein
MRSETTAATATSDREMLTVKEAADGTWRVPPNLVDVRRSREQTHPQFRLQVERPGPLLARARNRGPSFER